MMARLAAARDAYLRHQDVMLTDLDVVGDLDQVVHFRAATDDRLAEGGAVHGHVRAQLHVVLKDHGSNLGDLSVPSALLDVDEPVAADVRARMDDHPIADGHPLADRHYGMSPAVLRVDALLGRDNNRLGVSY